MLTRVLAASALCSLALAQRNDDNAQSCPFVRGEGCKEGDTIGVINAPERRWLAVDSIVDLSKVSRDIGHDVSALAKRAELNPGAREAGEMLRAIDARYAGTNDSVVDAINQLFARSGGRQDYFFCQNDAEMKYKTPGYPGGKQLFDNENWGTCDNFKLVDNKPEQPKPIEYIDEHILERQMLKHFFNNEFMEWNNNQNVNDPKQGNRYDSKASPVPGHASYCKYIEKFWNSDATKNQIGGFDAFTYVAEGYPSNAANGNEMVRLESKTNGIKATAFSPETAMRDVDALRRHFDVYDAKGNLKKGKKHVTIDDLGALCKDMKLAIMMVKYMDHPVVNGYFRAQGERVAIRLGEAERHITQQWGGQYVQQGLEGKWRAWIKETTEEVNDKVIAMVQLYRGFLDAQLGFAKKVPAANLSQKDKDAIKIIEATVKEADALKEFKNPF